MRLLPAALLVLLLAPAASAAPWLQAGYDASRSSATPDPGPATDDVGFTVQLPGSRAAKSTPLVFDGAVWVLTADYSVETLPPFTPGSRAEALRTAAVFRIDLTTAKVEEVVRVEGDGIASDGRSLFVTRDGGVDAYGKDGRLLWAWEHPALVAHHGRTVCAPPVVTEDALVVACEDRALDGGGTYQSTAGAFLGGAGVVRSQGEFFVAVLALEDGRARWFWRPEPEEPVGRGDVLFSGAYVDAVSVLGPFVFVNTQSAAHDVYITWMFEAATGKILWSWFHYESTEQGILGGQPPQQRPRLVYVPRPPVVGDENLAHARPGPLLHIVPHEERVAAQIPYPRPPGTPATLADGSTGLAATQTALYVNAWGTMHKYDRGSRTGVWNTTFETALIGRSIVVTPTSIYTFVGFSTSNEITALAVHDGRVLWRHAFQPMENTRPSGAHSLGSDWQFAVGERVLALAGLDGTVVVLGAPPAALQPRLVASTEYPAVGETVRIDLSGTGAGAFGPATLFRAVWGDGGSTEWQESPMLEHAYEERGDYRAEFFVRNAHNQTASTSTLVRVGTPKPTFLSEAFSADNQETTFFVLGLALTGAGAAIGLSRVGAKRRRLSRELAAIDRIHAATREDPPACEAALAERKAHARGLLVDGRLDETQYAVLERRIDELSRDLRLAALDERFQYLPLGMVRQLREMLSDGRVTEWEREHFEIALERERTMSDEQKSRVRVLVAEWFQRDTGSRQP